MHFTASVAIPFYQFVARAEKLDGFEMIDALSTAFGLYRALRHLDFLEDRFLCKVGETTSAFQVVQW